MTVILITRKTQIPKYPKLYAEIKMAQVLGSPLYICEFNVDVGCITRVLYVECMNTLKLYLPLTFCLTM